MDRKGIRPAETSRRGDSLRAPKWDPLREWNLSSPAPSALVDPARELEAAVTCRFKITGGTERSSQVQAARGGGA